MIHFPETVLKSASAFGLGLAGERETCGCVMGAALALGIAGDLSEGHSNTEQCNRLVSSFISEFRSRHGSTRCADLIKSFTDVNSPERKESCARLVESATQILVKLLSEASDPRPLSLAHLIRLIWDMPKEERTAARIVPLVRRVEIRREELDRHIVFSNEGYARNLFNREDDFEVLVMCWKPGQSAPPHDHHQSLSVELVYDGTLHYVSYDRPEEGGPLKEISSYDAPPGTVVSELPGNIHSLANPIESGKDAISIHFYFPPLKGMNFYDIETGAARWSSLGYLYIYNEAWDALQASCL